MRSSQLIIFSLSLPCQRCSRFTPDPVLRSLLVVPGGTMSAAGIRTRVSCLQGQRPALCAISLALNKSSCYSRYENSTWAIKSYSNTRDVWLWACIEAALVARDRTTLGAENSQFFKISQ